MPSFTNALTTIVEKWLKNQWAIKQNGLKIVDIIKSSLQHTSQEQSAENSVDVKLDEAISLYNKMYDSDNGGFGSQPKFPEIPRLSLLFHAYIVTKDASLLDMALFSLEKIANGGIHDHLGGGFSRYAVDAFWHVPHFEKMLYDQAQLMSAFATAYKLTGNVAYLEPALDIYKYVQRDLKHESGGFYAGEDADSLPNATDTLKIEGAFYAWTLKEIKEAIKENAAKYEPFLADMLIDNIIRLYSEFYDLKEVGNVIPSHDPHEHFVGKNILIIRTTKQEICDKYHVSVEQLQQILDTTNEILLNIRAARPRPHLDTKIICSWNALMLTGLCDLAACDTPASEQYLLTARQLYDFMRQQFYVADGEILLHACYGAADKSSAEISLGSRIEGFLDDYAFFINALINYYKLTLDFEVLQLARTLQETQHRLFWDAEHGGYFYTVSQSNDLVLRLKGDHDGAEPGGNSIAARNLVMLSHHFEEKSYAQYAEQIFRYFNDTTSFGYVLPQMMSALLLLEHGMDVVTVVGNNAASKAAFLQLLRKYYIPALIICQLQAGNAQVPVSQTEMERMTKFKQKFKMVDGKTTVYICHNRVCRLPITALDVLEKTLKENYFSPRLS